MRILIVDDSRTIRTLLRTTLAKLGHGDVAEAENGDAGAVALAAGSFDCVLLDLHMPGIDGLELLRRIKEDRRTQGIPVLIISSDSDLRSIERARQLGAAGFLRKPFNAEGIAKALQAAVAGPA